MVEETLNQRFLFFCEVKRPVIAAGAFTLQVRLALSFDEKNGETALMRGSGMGHLKCVKELLEKGAQVNVQSKDGLSSLMLASGNGHGKIVKVLLLAGAQANHQDAVSSINIDPCVVVL
ncbi:hypothetical protein EMCRGX_G006635 [Ephydatia muelleri]